VNTVYVIPHFQFIDTVTLFYYLAGNGIT